MHHKGIRNADCFFLRVKIGFIIFKQQFSRCFIKCNILFYCFAYSFFTVESRWKIESLKRTYFLVILKVCFLCKKSRSNTNKDDPKNMDLVVAKGTYMPKSLSTKVTGITITMRDLDYNVTEKDVTFNPADYPGVKIVDER